MEVVLKQAIVFIIRHPTSLLCNKRYTRGVIQNNNEYVNNCFLLKLFLFLYEVS